MAVGEKIGVGCRGWQICIPEQLLICVSEPRVSWTYHIATQRLHCPILKMEYGSACIGENKVRQEAYILTVVIICPNFLEGRKRKTFVVEERETFGTLAFFQT